MPHHYINSKGDETSQRVPRRVSSLWKLPDDVSACIFLHFFSIMQFLEKENGENKQFLTQ